MRMFRYVTQDIFARDPSATVFRILKSVTLQPGQRMIVQCRVCKYLKQRPLCRCLGLYMLSKLI